MHLLSLTGGAGGGAWRMIFDNKTNSQYARASVSDMIQKIGVRASWTDNIYLLFVWMNDIYLSFVRQHTKLFP